MRNGWKTFYAGQAGAYDDFRRRLLQGRQELWSQLIDARPGGVWVDMGGGTGANLECFGAAIDDFQQIYVSICRVAAESREATRRDSRLAACANSGSGRHQVQPARKRT